MIEFSTSLAIYAPIYGTSQNLPTGYSITGDGYSKGYNKAGRSMARQTKSDTKLSEAADKATALLQGLQSRLNGQREETPEAYWIASFKNILWRRTRASWTRFGNE